MGLFFSKKTISIVKKNRKTPWSLLLSQMSSFFLTEKKCESHKKVWGNKIFYSVKMASEDTTKILEFNEYDKSEKAQFIIYADLELLIEKIDGCKKNNMKIHLQQK